MHTLPLEIAGVLGIRYLLEQRGAVPVPASAQRTVVAPAAESCPTLVAALLPARLLCSWDSPGMSLEWVTASFSSESSWPRGRACVPCIAGSRLFTTEPPGRPSKDRRYCTCEHPLHTGYTLPRLGKGGTEFASSGDGGAAILR